MMRASSNASSNRDPPAAGFDEAGPFGEAAEAVRDVGRKAAAAVTDIGEDVYQSGARGGALVARYVGAHPVASIAIAASLGLFAGLLFSRR